MLSSKLVGTFHFLKLVRTVADGLIVSSAKKSLKPKSVLSVTAKKKSKKKTKKPRIVVKKLSDDIEDVWLENLNSENFKLYRKTSFGSFRKIDTNKLLDRLKEIFPTKFNNQEISSQIATDKFIPASTESASAVPTDDNERSPPYMSDFLIKHMVQFPLFKADSQNSLSEFIKEEKKDFGKIDAAMFPSVTAILSETMSENARLRLKEWKEGMIKKLGKSGFAVYQADLLNQGTQFHATLKRYLQIDDKQLVTISPQIEGCWKSLDSLLPEISNVKMVEEAIYHPLLAYKGIVDCVASYRGTPCVIEWKKSNKPKSTLSSTFDAPLQLCAYLGALSWNKNLSDLNIKDGLVVVAYTDGSPANIFPMDLETCQVHWIHWLRRLQSYWLKRSSTVILQDG